MPFSYFFLSQKIRKQDFPDARRRFPWLNIGLTFHPKIPQTHLVHNENSPNSMRSEGLVVVDLTRTHGVLKLN